MPKSISYIEWISIHKFKNRVSCFADGKTGTDRSNTLKTVGDISLNRSRGMLRICILWEASITYSPFKFTKRQALKLFWLYVNGFLK